MISQLLLHYCPDILINHQRPTFPANTSLSALSMDIFVISTATLRHSQSCHPNTTLSSTHYYYYCCLLLSTFSASCSFATFFHLHSSHWQLFAANIWLHALTLLLLLLLHATCNSPMSQCGMPQRNVSSCDNSNPSNDAQADGLRKARASMVIHDDSKSMKSQGAHLLLGPGCS